MSNGETAKDTAIAHYTARAPGYDEGHGGWHVELGRDFVKWLTPETGAAALDLACGTGLVTIPLAAAIGRRGVVVGVDITPAMLEEGRKKLVDPAAAPILWVEHDINDLDNVPEIHHIVKERGGFDTISCCSALVLLPDPAASIKSFASLLKRGGRLIIDVPADANTLQYMFLVQLRRAINLGNPFDRDWVKDVHSLEKLYADAGLEIEKSFKSRSYLAEKWFKDDQRNEVFEQQLRDMQTGYKDSGKLEEAREAWKGVWQYNLSEDGTIYQGHPLYISIGRKP